MTNLRWECTQCIQWAAEADSPGYARLAIERPPVWPPSVGGISGVTGPLSSTPLAHWTLWPLCSYCCCCCCLHQGSSCLEGHKANPDGDENDKDTHSGNNMFPEQFNCFERLASFTLSFLNTCIYVDVFLHVFNILTFHVCIALYLCRAQIWKVYFTLSIAISWKQKGQSNFCL